ncbi:MAG: acyl-CoA thioester hydrolase/BAAT C-terminal domain-containing protein, partial [Candidatus Micrarchaeota archaeon]|nr:acyl-CoA thioester hydrolase/BAAT C-terminal domain-containing protein [Candidatus Micrarchaeota archaeon]
KLKFDLTKILEFVQSQPNIDKNRVGILAQSFGTSVVAALAPKVKAIVLMGSVAHPKEIMGISMKWEKLDQNGISTKVKETSKEVITIGPQFWSDFDNYNLPKSIRKIHYPILFIHGAKDNRIPVSEMEAYFKSANEPKEKIIIQGAEHSMEPKREEMYGISVAWFEKHLA